MPLLAYPSFYCNIPNHSIFETSDIWFYQAVRSNLSKLPSQSFTLFEVQYLALSLFHEKYVKTWRCNWNFKCGRFEIYFRNDKVINFDGNM